MKTHFRRLKLRTVFILIVPFMFMSCEKSGKGLKYPEPSENPVYLTAEAQTKNVSVKYMKLIGSLDNKDIITENMTQTATRDIWRQIKHDWVTVKCGDDVPKGVVRVTVEQNTTTEFRTYQFITLSTGLKTTLTIIQKGASSN